MGPALEFYLNTAMNKRTFVAHLSLMVVKLKEQATVSTVLIDIAYVIDYEVTRDGKEA